MDKIERMRNMQNITYRKILMDEGILAKVENANQFAKQYSSICIARGSHLIQNATLYGCEVFCQRGIKDVTLADFIEYHKHLGDLKEWLYVSQNLVNIYFVQQQYQMNCCFINNGLNDCMDISNIHEVGSIQGLQKVWEL